MHFNDRSKWTAFKSTVVWIIKKSCEISDNGRNCCLPDHMSKISRAKEGRCYILHFRKDLVQSSLKPILSIKKWGLVFHSSCNVAGIFHFILNSGSKMAVNSFFNQVGEILYVLTSRPNEICFNTSVQLFWLTLCFGSCFLNLIDQFIKMEPFFSF